jgi:hypothetical protein
LSGVELSASQPTVHAPLVHVGAPAPVSGPEHTLPQVLQFAGSVGSTQVPLQSSVVGAGQPASLGGPESVLASLGESDAKASPVPASG